MQTDNSGLTSGDPFPVGTTPQGFEICDGAGICTTCEFNVIVNEFPDATEVLSANDNVQVSLDADGGCSLIGIDAFLEGGPYGCLDNFFYQRSPAYSGPDCGVIANPLVGCPNAAGAIQGAVPFSCEDIGLSLIHI